MKKFFFYLLCVLPLSAGAQDLKARSEEGQSVLSFMRLFDYGTEGFRVGRSGTSKELELVKVNNSRVVDTKKLPADLFHKVDNVLIAIESAVRADKLDHCVEIVRVVRNGSQQHEFCLSSNAELAKVYSLLVFDLTVYLAEN